MVQNGPFGDAYNYMSVHYLLEQVTKYDTGMAYF